MNKSVNGCIKQYGFMEMLNLFYHIVLQAEVQGKGTGALVPKAVCYGQHEMSENGA